MYCDIICLPSLQREKCARPSASWSGPSLYISVFCIIQWFLNRALIWLPESRTDTGLFNPFMPNGLIYLKSLDSSISCIRGVWLVFIITMLLKNFWTYHKNGRPLSDSACCSIWSGSTLFANIPFMVQHYLIGDSNFTGGIALDEITVLLLCIQRYVWTV